MQVQWQRAGKVLPLAVFIETIRGEKTSAADVSATWHAAVSMTNQAWVRGCMADDSVAS